MRNLRTAYDDTLLAMAELEGADWLERQLSAGPDQPTCVAASLAHGAEQLAKAAALRVDAAKCDDPMESDWLLDLAERAALYRTTVYGNGGSHRYFVSPDGSVTFGAGFALESGRRAAEALGFWLSGA